MESNANNQLIYAKNIFSITPSFLDIMANVDADIIIQKWKEALSKGEIKLVHDVCLMQMDIRYLLIFYQRYHLIIYLSYTKISAKSRFSDVKNDLNYQSSHR